MQCPCGSEKLLENCCAPYISGASLPDTAEALMRSRYTAYCQTNIDYIGTTMTGPAAQDIKIPVASHGVFLSHKNFACAGKARTVGDQRGALGSPLETPSPGGARGKPREINFNAEEAEKWAKQCVWRGLRVIKSWPDPTDANRAFVEFIAEYTIAGKQQSLHETSEFHRIDGRWFYVDGTFAKTKQEKIGRNSPCSCGSGKKFKTCCASK